MGDHGTAGPVPTPRRRGQDEGTGATAPVAEDSSASGAKAPFLLQSGGRGEEALDRRGGRRAAAGHGCGHTLTETLGQHSQRRGVSCAASGAWAVAQVLRARAPRHRAGSGALPQPHVRGGCGPHGPSGSAAAATEGPGEGLADQAAATEVLTYQDSGVEATPLSGEGRHGACAQREGAEVASARLRGLKPAWAAGT